MNTTTWIWNGRGQLVRLEWPMKDDERGDGCGVLILKITIYVLFFIAFFFFGVGFGLAF